MKRILSLLLCAFLPILASGQTLNRLAASYHIGSERAQVFTNRVSSTLNAMIVQIGTRQADIVIDEGTWTIDQDVTFPTNIGVIVTPPACFDVQSNVTLEINGYFFAEPRNVFCGTDGTITGSADCIYYWSDWGPTGDVDIRCVTEFWDMDFRDDVTTQNIASVLSNQFPELDYDFSDDVIWITATNPPSGTDTGNVVRTETATGVVYEVQFPNPDPVNFPTGASATISGFQLGFVDGFNVTIGPGQAVVDGDLVVQTNTTTNSVAFIPAGLDFMYVYLATNGNISITNAEPAFNAELGGFYQTGQTERCVGFLYTPVGGAVIGPFVNSGDTYLTATNSIAAHSTFPTVVNQELGYWTNLNMVSATVASPVFARETSCIALSDDAAGNTATIALAPKEVADLDIPIAFAGGVVENASVYNHSSEEAGIQGWVTLGPSREIYYFAEATDDGSAVFINGWRINR